MDQQTGLAVPKDRVNVAVRMSGGTELKGSIFLEYAAESETLHHRIVTFLEDKNHFFPLQVEGGETEFLHKKKINLIEVKISGDQQNLPLLLSLMHAVGITAVFADGSSLNGSLLADVPVEKSRLSDCLNLPETFVCVKRDQTLCYVNKEALLNVVHTREP